MSDPVVFDNPLRIPNYDIATSQVSKVMRFESTTTEFIDEAKVVVSSLNAVVKTMTIGNGITRDVDRMGIEVTFNGSDFVSIVGKDALVECSFFTEGDRDIIFNLIARRSFL